MFKLSSLAFVVLLAQMHILSTQAKLWRSRYLQDILRIRSSLYSQQTAPFVPSALDPQGASSVPVLPVAEIVATNPGNNTPGQNTKPAGLLVIRSSNTNSQTFSPVLVSSLTPEQQAALPSTGSNNDGGGGGGNKKDDEKDEKKDKKKDEKKDEGSVSTNGASDKKKSTKIKKGMGMRRRRR